MLLRLINVRFLRSCVMKHVRCFAAYSGETCSVKPASYYEGLIDTDSVRKESKAQHHL